MNALIKVAGPVGQLGKSLGKNLAVNTAASKVPGGKKILGAVRAGGEAKRRAKSGRKAQEQARKSKKPPEIKSIVPNKTSSLEETYFQMRELEKQAADTHKSMGSTFTQGLGQGAAALAATAGIMGGIHGANKLYNKMQTERIWKRLKKENPDLTKTQKDRENFEVLQKFSPDIASNITTARSYLQRAQQTYMAPHEFVKDLTSVQDTRRKGGLAYALENVAGRSVETGLKQAELQNAMDEVWT